jgi:hypothetical protein
VSFVDTVFPDQTSSISVCGRGVIVGVFCVFHAHTASISGCIDGRAGGVLLVSVGVFTGLSALSG